MFDGERFHELLGLRRFRKLREQPLCRRVRAIARILHENFRIEPLQKVDRARQLIVFGIAVLPIANRAFGKLRRRERLFCDIVIDVVTQSQVVDRIADSDDAQFERPEILVTRSE